MQVYQNYDFQCGATTITASNKELLPSFTLHASVITAHLTSQRNPTISDTTTQKN